MDWVRYELGHFTWNGESRSQPGVVVEIADKYVRLASDGVHAHPRQASREGSRAPFTWEDRGKKHRLIWELGSVTLTGHGEPVVWNQRFAAICNDQTITVASATSDRVATLKFEHRLDPSWASWKHAASDGRLWISSSGSVYAIALAELEQLIERTQGGPHPDVTITLRAEYPLHRPNARLDCVYLWRMQAGDTMVEIGDGKGGASEPKLTIDLPPLTLAKYSPLVLVDELSPNRWLRAEIPNHPIQILDRTEAPITFVANVKVAKAEPAQGKDRPVVAHAAATQRSRIDTLIASITAEPEVDHHREVLLDLLHELEDPAAPLFAAVRAGEKISAARKRAALGALAPYIVDYESRGGLPVAGTFSRSASHARTLLEEGLADYRLSLLTALRIGAGPYHLYSKFITSAGATALRDIDITHMRTIDAIIAAKRGQFTRIGQLPVAKPRFMAKLAHTLFDRATTFHGVIDRKVFPIAIKAIVANPKGVYTRVVRRLELEDDLGNNEALVKLVRPWAAQIPVQTLVVGGVRMN